MKISFREAHSLPIQRAQIAILRLLLLGLTVHLHIAGASPEKADESDLKSGSVLCSVVLEERALIANKIKRLGPSLHSIPALVEGGLHGVLKQVKQISPFASTLIIGASNTFSIPTMIDGNDGQLVPNIGYWPSNHMDIDPLLGGEYALKKVIQEANKQNVVVILDMPLAHFGYTPTELHQIIDKNSHPEIEHDPIKKQLTHAGRTVRIDPKREVYFSGAWTSTQDLLKRGLLRLNESVEQSEWTEFEETNDRNKVLNMWDEVFSKKRLYGLHGLMHSEIPVQAYFVRVFKKLIDMGIRGFRLDAALYVDRFALTNIINEVNAYAKSRNTQEPIWILELLTPSHFALDTMMDDLIERVEEKFTLYFFEFPQMFHFKEMKESPHYSLTYYLGYLGHREQIGIDTKRMIPTPVNHDFGARWNYLENTPTHNARVLAQELVSYAMIEFTSYQSSLILQGTEKPKAADDVRIQVNNIDSEGPVAVLVKKFHDALKPYRKSDNLIGELEIFAGSQWSSLKELYDLMKNRDSDSSVQNLLTKLDKTQVWRLKPSGSKKSILLVINLEYSATSFNVTGISAERLREKYKHGSATLALESGGTKMSIKLAGPSVSLIELD